MPTSPAQFQEGDPVVIVASPETIEAGLAGLDGHVAGYTHNLPKLGCPLLAPSRPTMPSASLFPTTGISTGFLQTWCGWPLAQGLQETRGSGLEHSFAKLAVSERILST
jgi:hypothetical protein